MSLAFFVVNFGYSKSEYEELTPREIAFIHKAYEDKQVNESTLMRNAVLNAIGNAFRKKGKSFQELWKKKPKAVDIAQARADYEFVQELEDEEGKEWVNKVYEDNGLVGPYDLSVMYQNMPVKKLKTIAKHKGHKGYSKMKKQELIELLIGKEVDYG